MAFFSRLYTERLEDREMLTSIGFVEREIVRGEFWAVTSSDLNGDGDRDLLVVEREEQGLAQVSLFENTDGAGFATESRRIGSVPNRLVVNSELQVTDLDNDGDKDVVFIGYQEMPVWFENELGNASSWIRREVGRIPSGLDAASRLVDIDGDNDLDIVAIDSRNLYIYKNDDGEFVVDAQEDLFTIGPTAFLLVDFDDDGDQDLIRHLGGDPDDESGTIRRFMYHEAIGEEYSLGMEFSVFEPAQDIFGVTLYAADVNQDAALDLVVAGIGGVKAYLYQDGSFAESPVGWGRTGWFANRAHVADVDADGDVDVVVAVDGTTDGGSVDWFENLDGSGLLSPLRQISATPRFEFHYRSVSVADLDADGDLDVVATAFGTQGGETGLLSWLEQRRVGDADNDGRVDFADFLALSASFGQAADALWEDGDFNADGGVDFEDFLLLSSEFGS